MIIQQIMIEYVKYYDSQMCKEHPNWLFLFGDNDVRWGKRGQSIIRDEPNALGIPTKKLPSLNPDAFYTDDELHMNKLKIDDVFELIHQVASRFEKIVLPQDGIGTGLADLPRKAPQTFAYLETKIEELIRLHGG